MLPYSCVPLGHHSPGTRDSRRQWRDRGEQKGREARQPQCVGHPPGGHREVPSRLHLGKRARGMSWTEGGLTPPPRVPEGPRPQTSPFKGTRDLVSILRAHSRNPIPNRQEKVGFSKGLPSWAANRRLLQRVP